MRNLHLIFYALLIVFFSSCKGRSSSEVQQKKANKLEKPNIKLGFVKLTDMGPLAIAQELGYFNDEGLEVELIPQSTWKNILDRVIDEQLDGAQMLAGQAIASSAGYGRQAELLVPMALNLNGSCITVSSEVWEDMEFFVPKKPGGRPVHPIHSDALIPVIEGYKDQGREFNFGMVYPVSTHNYELRYWLAASGIHPGMYTETNLEGTADAQVLLSVIPPPNLPSKLESGALNAYAVGEPWNQIAVNRGVGVPIIANYHIWKNNPGKVLAFKKSFVDANPKSTEAIVKALLRAGKWLDNPKNRNRAAGILSKPEYVGADSSILVKSLTGLFEFEKGDLRSIADFHVFFRYNATYPYYSDGIWYLTQMRRWGQINTYRPAEWYNNTIRKVYYPDLWRRAARALVKEGKLSKLDIPNTDGYKAPSEEFIDALRYDPQDPIGYINSFDIGNKERVQ